MKQWIILSALAAVILVPFILRPDSESIESADDVLVLITPHNEAIRHEFGIAFATNSKSAGISGFRVHSTMDD